MRPYLKIWVAFIFMATITKSMAQTVDMTVKQGPNVDVMVTVGTSNVDLSTFETDLEQSMNTKGIPLGKLRVEAFERSSISSDQADASDIFNSWNVMDFNGAEPPNPHNYLSTAGGGAYNGSYFSFDSNTNEIIADPVARNSGNYGVAMYDPTGDVSDGTISATFGLSGAPYVHAEVGFIFRKVDNDNFYAYIIDNHTYCGNLQGYASGDGFPAEAILKRENGVTTILAVNTNSGLSGSATYGWDGNRSDMFGAFFNGQAIDFKIEMSGDNIKVSRKGGGGSAGTDWIESFNITDTTHAAGSYGFYVHEQQNAYFKDIVIEKLELRAFKDVLREPQWRNSALRFNVNLDDIEVADFDVDTDLSEILMRTINEDIHYIGWGTNANQAQFERFIIQNNNKGTFINRDSDSWATWMDAMAQYIYEQYQFGTVTAGDYFIAGTSVEIDVDPSQLKTNTANASYPNGRWKITHDNTHFENNTGQVSWHNLFLEDVPEYYEKPGEYTFTFEELPTAPSILYFHRKPVASFTYSSDTGFINNTSYDQDGGANNGIAQSEWKWKSVDATSTNDWTLGAFDKNSVADGQYLIMLTVQDHQGAWSTPSSIYVEKSSSSGGSSDLPIAQFNIQPDQLNTYTGNMTIVVEDNSVDPYGRTLTVQEWIITQRTYDGDGNPNDTEIYNSTTPMTDFSAYNNLTADYIISQRVQTDTGVWSEPFFRTLAIVDDNTLPTISATPANGTIDTNTDIALVFQDEASGSGFDVQRYAMVQNATPPATGDASWTSWSNSQSKTVNFSSGGNGWYIHAEAQDNAGNVGTQTFGPYDIALVVSADDDLAVLDEDTVSDPIDVLFNDTYDTNNTPVVTITVQGTKGNAVVNGSNQVIYTPDADEFGIDTITYQLDDNGTTVTAVITLSIIGQDDPPTANPDDFSLDENDTLNEDVSTNDVEIDEDDLTYHLIEGPSHSTSFTLNTDGTFSYEHNGDEVSTDSFTYNFEDANSFSETVTVTLNINPVNDLPTGANTSIVAIKNEGYAFSINDFTFNDDDTGDAFNGIQVISLPSNGTLTYNGFGVNLNDYIDTIESLIYAPNPDEFGTNYTNFDFKVKDLADGLSAAAYTLTVDVIEPPIITSLSPMVVKAGDPITISGNQFTDVVSVKVDGLDASFTIQDDNTITATVPYGANSGLVTVASLTASATGEAEVHAYTSASCSTGWGNAWQTLTTVTEGALRSVTVRLGNAHVSNNYQLYLELHSEDDNPGESVITNRFNTLIQTSEEITVPANTPSQEFTFVFDGSVYLEGATPYYIVLKENAGNPARTGHQGINKDCSANGTTDGGAGNSFGRLNHRFAMSPMVEINDAPTDFELTSTEINENNTNPQPIGSLSATDADYWDIHNFTLVVGPGDTDNASFEIAGNTLNAIEVLDYEAKASYTIRIRATDGYGDFFEKQLTITVLDVYEDVDGDAVEDHLDNCLNTSNSDQTDTNNDGEGDACDDDDDGDGTLDDEDDFPLDENEDTDTDGDGIGDNADTDDDNDGTPDDEDAFPKDPTEDTDTDGDGTGDNTDTDDDNDGIPDDEDAFPKDPTEDTDTDGDGTGDNTDTDDDNDGTPDDEDAFPKDPTEDTDTDGDGTGDNTDTDDDNDGTPDDEDAFPKDPTEDTDTDGDGTGDNTDTDDDNDGTPDDEDAFPKDPTEDTDTDGDGTGDNTDTDDDNDGIPDDEDAFPKDPTEDTDTDGDGIGNNTDNDDDNDGVPDSEDNEPLDNTDTDGDGIPDSQDDDDDNDGTDDVNDVFPLDAEEDTDTDWDGIGDNADSDDDDDGVPDVDDAFPKDPTEQSDNDNDGVGDNADTDDDNDGVADGDDDFPNNSEPLITPAQAFTPNGDGINEAWIIPGIDNYPNNIVKVFNRWGHIVYGVNGYQNDWEGFYKNNREKLPAGSYMYVIDLGDGSKPIQGWIYINY
ncbi:gliding motility-associated C-terminal domain-containing protein [Flagellimonas sp.]|uniref:T9SS type B sorting domain-containing protein n=1 Tax=Flagellimonas sp. TaxID=2058762 RepID=UPI003B503B7A